MQNRDCARSEFWKGGKSNPGIQTSKIFFIIIAHLICIVGFLHGWAPVVAAVRLGAAYITAEDGLVLARDLHGSVGLFTRVGFAWLLFRPSELLQDLHYVGQGPVGDDVLSVVEGISALRAGGAASLGSLAVAAQAGAAEIVPARRYGHRVLETLQANGTSDFVAEIP